MKTCKKLAGQRNSARSRASAAGLERGAGWLVCGAERVLVGGDVLVDGRTDGYGYGVGGCFSPALGD